MNLIRVLIIALLVWLAYRAIRGMLSKPRPGKARRPESLSTDMVRCQHCGIHIPKHEALPRGEHYYCSPEHRDLDQG
ncbi:MAG: hypothetical protein K0A95_06280 [Chromatiales bacterium]|nr:hypothetical protein [Gammaproteobacteria bacterium]MBW6476661.1 hypothetical protein [Chromatiales bacterium]